MDEPLGFELYSGTTTGGSGTAHEVFADRLGSVIKVVEAATGTVVSDQRFDSFGLHTATGPLLQRYGFTGREHDAESGLIYYRARAYDPEIGQFLQRDPTGFAAGDLNLYAYTWNDPYNWRDPSGLGTVENTALTAGLITAGVGVTGCVVTEPCRKGLFGALYDLANRIGNILKNDGIPGDEPDNPPDNPPVPDTGDCDPNDPKCLEEPSDSDEVLKDRLQNKNFKEAEQYLDRQLRDGRGWTKEVTRNGKGIRYFDGKGNAVRIMPGTSRFTGPSIKSGPNAIISGGSNGKIRIGLMP